MNKTRWMYVALAGLVAAAVYLDNVPEPASVALTAADCAADGAKCYARGGSR